MQRIQNFDVLATSTLREDALTLALVGYDAMDVGAELKRKLILTGESLSIGDTDYSLAGRHLFFVGVGKCAFVAAEAIQQIFGDRLTSGIALGVGEAPPTLASIATYSGTHPLPSETNVEATTRILEFLSGREENDLVLMLISGGGSTLLCSPEEPMTCVEESGLFHTLTAHGASIQELNTVRKHISRARGGGLAIASYPAEVISLIVSDVPGNDMEYISSGPTLRDTSTVADARAVLEKYGVPIIPPLTLRETEKEEKYFKRVTNTLFLTNVDALEAMRKAAVERGYQVQVVTDRLTGEAREVAHTILEALHAATPKTVLLYAGETTVTVGSAGGAGGRNQELALATLEDVREDEIVLPCASDGHDNTDHAGAIGDALSRTHAAEKGLSVNDYLETHRSYDFFITTDDALVTGYTGSNVSDFIIAIKQ